MSNFSASLTTAILVLGFPCVLLSASGCSDDASDVDPPMSTVDASAGAPGDGGGHGGSAGSAHDASAEADAVAPPPSCEGDAECAPSGGICRGKVCVDNPCIPNPCVRPSECASEVEVTTYAEGSCALDAQDQPQCSSGSIATTTLCSPATPVCVNGACAVDCGPGVVCPADYFVAPDGNDDNPGTADRPFATLTKLWTVISAGDLAYLRGGTYSLASQPDLKGKNGTSDHPIRIFAYPGETPVFTRLESYPQKWGISFSGDYFHFRGLELTGFTQRTATELAYAFRAVDSSHNVFELFNSHHNAHGMRIQETSGGISTDNLVVNSDFHHNQDPLTSDTYGNADGLEIAYLSEGRTHTVRGCRFWWNTDDGLDLWENDGDVVVDNCWAWHNGYIPDTFGQGGDGNGLKMGKTNGSYPSTIKRKVHNCLSFQNRASGLSQNSAKCQMEIFNNTFYKNGTDGILLFGIDAPQYLRNNISYANAGEILNSGYAVTEDHNSWDTVFVVTDADFLSVDMAGVDGPRQPDGSLPILDFMRLAPGSDLINAGADVGLPFSGAAPDLGAFETE